MRKRRRASLDAIRDLNQMRYDVLRDPEIETRIAAYEMAYRMQTSVPDVMDISKEPPRCTNATARPREGHRSPIIVYWRGVWSNAASGLFNCITGVGTIMAARMATSFSISKNAARKPIKPVRRSSRTLKNAACSIRHLIVWGGEFGRTPMMQGNLKPDQLGRDHHPHGYTVWMAGGGIKPGIVYGKTDDFGFYAVDEKVHVHDLHATILHLFGLEHTKLTYRFQGRDFRLTDVHGEAVKALMA